MTKFESMTNDQRRLDPLRHSLFVIFSSFFISLSIQAANAHAADNLGVLGSRPRWNVLENYQETITHDEFAHLVNDVYCTHGFSDDLIKIDNDSARILENHDANTFFTLHFAADDASRKPVPRLWRPATSLPLAAIEGPLIGHASILKLSAWTRMGIDHFGPARRVT